MVSTVGRAESYESFDIISEANVGKPRRSVAQRTRAPTAGQGRIISRRGTLRLCSDQRTRAEWRGEIDHTETVRIDKETEM